MCPIIADGLHRVGLGQKIVELLIKPVPGLIGNRLVDLDIARCTYLKGSFTQRKGVQFPPKAMDAGGYATVANSGLCELLEGRVIRPTAKGRRDVRPA